MEYGFVEEVVGSPGEGFARLIVQRTILWLTKINGKGNSMPVTYHSSTYLMVVL